MEKSVVRELSTLRAEAAELAAKHLVMTGRLLDEDPETAYEHAMAARRCGPRVAVIREAVGIAAYTSGRWAEALAELRTARRISGDDEHWPMMADCERALGRPEKALAMASAPEVQKLSKPSLIEMRIVAAGARADLGQLDAAVVTLQTADLNVPNAAWAPRLRFAYAAALEAAGRRDEAREWYAKAAAVDPEGETDAAARLQELDGIHFLDEDNDLKDFEGADAADLAAAAAEPASESGPASAVTGSAAIPADDQSDGAPSSAPAAQKSASPAAAAAGDLAGSPTDPTAAAAVDLSGTSTDQPLSAAPTTTVAVDRPETPADPTAAAAGDLAGIPADQTPSAEPTTAAAGAQAPAAPAASSTESTSPFSEKLVVESPHADSAPSMPAGGLFLDAALPAPDTDDDEDEGDEA